MLLIAWSLPEVAASIGLIYGGVISLIVVLVRLERSLDVERNRKKPGASE